MTQDLWRPSASIHHLKKRAKLISGLRQFFQERGYLEVETPSLARHAVTDVYLSNIKARFRERDYYLQTSPEYHMKRLLAAGSGPIFQLSKSFRDDELGRWHNPEFTLLEWYQLSIDHHQLMEEVDALLKTILNCSGLIKISYQQAFMEYCQIDPFKASIQELQSSISQSHLQHVLPSDELDKDQFLFLLMSHVVEPALAKIEAPVAVYDFPLSQAALAKIDNNVAQRFEIYYKGIELANGFHELTDPQIQLLRFQQDNQIRRQRGLEEKALDKPFLKALHHGLPECSGVALGVDRLVALALELPDIRSALSFDISRA